MEKSDILKAILANSPNANIPAMLLGGQLQRCPLLSGKAKANAASSATAVSEEQWCPLVPSVLPEPDDDLTEASDVPAT